MQACHDRLLRRLILTIGMILIVSNHVEGAPPTAPSSGMVLRVRLPDGSLQKLRIDKEKSETTSLQDALRLLEVHQDNISSNGPERFTIEAQVDARAPPVAVDDASQTLAALRLGHGSLVTLRRPKSENNRTTSSDSRKRKLSRTPLTKVWNPFPDLARNYYDAVRRQQQRRTQGGRYADLVARQAQLHLVEAQPEGYLRRVYMCRTSAERFRKQLLAAPSSRTAGTAASPAPRRSLPVGLLLGTVARERVNLERRRARTSLSSTTEQEEFCQVAKVQALVAWPPPSGDRTTKTDSPYDASRLLSLRSHDNDISKNGVPCSSVLRVAGWLGLQPVGWIFMYDDDRLKEAGTLPVLSGDVYVAGALQVQEMKAADRADSSRAFCTLAMDAETGATDAFQLSDVSVQMVAEGMMDSVPSQPTNRLIKLGHEVIVDGEEVTEFDSVLCLVNTAMLSHEGTYSGTNSIKKNGTLTKKTKNALSQAIENGDDDALLQTLTDFNLLIALDEWLGPKDSEALCQTVRQFVRGQKRSTSLDQPLKGRIRTILESH